MQQDAQAIASAVPFPNNMVIGLDLGDRWSRYCMLDNAGSVKEEDRVRSTDQALEARFGTLPAMRFVIETGTHSPWVSRLLKGMGHSVVVANARKLRMIYESNRKNDRQDARMLARLGRADVELLAPVRHRSAKAQADLAVVRGCADAAHQRVSRHGQGHGRAPAQVHHRSLRRQGENRHSAGAAGCVTTAVGEHPHVERTDRELRSEDSLFDGERISADQAAAAGKRSGAAGCVDLRAHVRGSASFREQPCCRQLSRAVPTAVGVGQQCAPAGYHQSGQQSSSQVAGAKRALHAQFSGLR